MPFPLPLDPQFRKEVIRAWLDDIDDQLECQRVERALESWQIANSLYLGLPPGNGDITIEEQLVGQRVRISKHLHPETNANSI